MDKEILRYVGKNLYNLRVLKEFKRYVVFMTRCHLHSKYMDEILDFFAATDLRQKMLRGTPSFVEQVTRAFFYKNSSWAERTALVKNHIIFLEERFKPELLQKLYAENQRIRVWEDCYQEKPLGMDLWFHGGQRKEGCLSLVLNYEGEELYQIMFWLGHDQEKEPALFIGALQGTPNGSEIIKSLTKAFFGYRTKNLIFYGIRNIADCMGIKNIYAVANEGYYAMNHLRRDRKLKTSLDDFWQECEGERCEDQRFYKMPVAEHRKAMEELKPSKRAQHRRRFAKMDEITVAVSESLAAYRK